MRVKTGMRREEEEEEEGGRRCALPYTASRFLYKPASM